MLFSVSPFLLGDQQADEQTSRRAVCLLSHHQPAASLTRHGTEAVAVVPVLWRRAAPLHAVATAVGRALGVVAAVVQEGEVAKGAV